MTIWIARKFFSRGLVSLSPRCFIGKIDISLTRLFSSKCVDNDHIAIDLGDSNYRVAVMEGQSARVIDTSPSVVAFNDKGELLFGTKAKQQGFTHPKTVVYGINRLMGRKFDDPIIQNEMKRVLYNIVKGPYGDACVEVYGNVYHPEMITTEILTHIKKTAESYLRKPVCKTFLVSPQHYDDDTLRRLGRAMRMAGLGTHMHLFQGICPVISAGLIKHEGLIAILNLGGRTFSASILNTTDQSREWKTKKYDMFLGGEDVDNALLAYLVSEFKKSEGIDLGNDNVAIKRLCEACEKAKMELSYLSETEVNLPYITSTASGAKHLNITVRRSKFESLIDDIIKRIRSSCVNCLQEAGVSGNDVDEVIFVGGTSRVPKIKSSVAEIFGKNPRIAKNPDEAVVLGAAAMIEAGVFPKDVWEQLQLLKESGNRAGILSNGGNIPVNISVRGGNMWPDFWPICKSVFRSWLDFWPKCGRKEKGK